VRADFAQSRGHVERRESLASREWVALELD
jgi:hypothetical protein